MKKHFVKNSFGRLFEKEEVVVSLVSSYHHPMKIKG